MTKSIAPRREIKFLLDETRLGVLEFFLRNSQMSFAEFFEPRTINTIYFDDPTMSSMRAHLRKELCRSKLRLRWYGEDSNVCNGQLELKEKKFGTGLKHMWPINCNLSASWSDVRKEMLPQLSCGAQGLLLANAIAPLYIRYRRRYFLSRNGLLRVTFDRSIQASDERFHAAFGAHRLRPITSSPCIMEIKYNISDSERAERFLKSLPQMPKGCSKYILCAAAVGIRG